MDTDGGGRSDTDHEGVVLSLADDDLVKCYSQSHHLTPGSVRTRHPQIGDVGFNSNTFGIYVGVLTDGGVN